jgi:hypothetical protein
MRNYQVRLAECVLLALAIVSAGTPPFIPLAWAQTPPSQRRSEPTPRAGRSRAEQAHAEQPPGIGWRYIVAEGKLTPVAVSIGNSCKSPHLFSIRSGEGFFQFDEPTDSVLITSAVGRNFVARIDSRGLKRGVYNVKVIVECVDCKKQDACGLIRRELVAEVTVVGTQPHAQQGNPQPPQTTTQPTDDGMGTGTKVAIGAGAAAGALALLHLLQHDSDAKNISENGPQFSDNINPSDFKFKAFLKGGWPVFFEYELTQPGHVTLTITAKKAPPFTHVFKETSPGRHAEFVQLPPELGAETIVATYAIKATSDLSPGAALVPLDIIGFTAGDKAVGSSGLDHIVFQPRSVQVIGGRAATNAAYSFHTIRPFSGGARVEVRLVDSSGKHKRVSEQQLNRALAPDETINGLWDCRKGSSPSLGSHKLYAFAWFTIQEGGDQSFGIAPSTVLVQR